MATCRLRYREPLSLNLAKSSPYMALLIIQTGIIASTIYATEGTCKTQVCSLVIHCATYAFRVANQRTSTSLLPLRQGWRKIFWAPGLVLTKFQNRDWLRYRYQSQFQVMTVPERQFSTGTAVYTTLRLVFRQIPSKIFPLLPSQHTYLRLSVCIMGICVINKINFFFGQI